MKRLFLVGLALVCAAASAFALQVGPDVAVAHVMSGADDPASVVGLLASMAIFAPAVVTGSVTFANQPVEGTPAHYLLTLTEAGGAVLTALGALTDASITIPSVPAGTWVGSVAIVDADNKPLVAAVSDPTPLVIDAVVPVTFNVPTALALSAA